MSSEQFIYWLQGYVEISGEYPSPEEWQIIKDHLKLVFEKHTPEYEYTTTSTPFDKQVTIC